MVDLHFHSTFSDGSETPEELVQRGKDIGLTAMVLTDHDSTRGTERFVETARGLGICTMPGVELSIEFDAGELHLLGYGFDMENGQLQEYLELFRTGRTRRNEQMVEKLNQLGVGVSYEAIVQSAGDADVVGRAHIATAMVSGGYVKNKKEVFNHWIGAGCPAFVPRFRMSVTDAIRLIAEAGGIPVMAHPHHIGFGDEKLHALLRELKPQGLEGIEAYHSEHSDTVTARLILLAQNLGLRVTGGTDCHGTFTPDIHLGHGFGGMRIPDSCYTWLEEKQG